MRFRKWKWKASQYRWEINAGPQRPSLNYYPWSAINLVCLGQQSVSSSSPRMAPSTTLCPRQSFLPHHGERKEYLMHLDVDVVINRNGTQLAFMGSSLSSLFPDRLCFASNFPPYFPSSLLMTFSDYRTTTKWSLWSSLNPFTPLCLWFLISGFCLIL